MPALFKGRGALLWMFPVWPVVLLSAVVIAGLGTEPAPHLVLGLEGRKHRPAQTGVRLPLLFALDAKYGIEGGFNYVPDCKAIESNLT